MMQAVVAEGTGVSAQIPGIPVAGKTGTAELGPKPGQELPPPDPDNPDAEPPEPEMEVDAWFVAFAPANRPRYVVAVMLVNAEGDGGEVAAPIARQVLESLL
jgi:peptidoglycan glycosyltransferase